MPTPYSVQPQRANNGWKACEPHQAQRFAVLLTKHLTINGKPTRTSRVVNAHSTREAAQAVADTLNAAAGRQRKGKHTDTPTLGQRFLHTGRKIIARSLSKEQYDAIK